MNEEKGLSCELGAFEPRICSPERQGVLFLGKHSLNIDEIMDALEKAELGMEVSVLDMSGEHCEALSRKYTVDQDASQFIVFQRCEKVSGISLDEDPEGQLRKLKESLNAREG